MARFLMVGSENLLTDTQVCRSYFQQFVGIDEVQSLLRDRILGGVRRRASSALEERVLVSCFFLQTLISMSSPSGLTDDHTGYTFSPGPMKSTTLLRIVQTVGDRFTGFKCDQGTHLTILDISLVGAVVVEYGVQDTVTLGIGHELATVTNQSSCGDGELQTGVSAAGDGTHVSKLHLSADPASQ